MRRTSLRIRLLGLSVAFSAALVGAILSVTYLVVIKAMRDTAEAGVAQLAVPAKVAFDRRIEMARESVAADPPGAGASSAAAEKALLAELDELYSTGPLGAAGYALHGASGELLWSTAGGRVLPAAPARARVLAAGASGDVTQYGARPLSGLLGPADMGDLVMHIPVELPFSGAAVLDVVYSPHREEAVIDSVRAPMTLLAVISAMLSLAIMQSGAAWVLGLVEVLRKAADSIQAGEPEVRLPEVGDNEVGDLARSINEVIRKLDRRAEAQARFVADASHELATPVAGIRGYVNILRVWGAEDPALRDEAVGAIDRESRRMARLCAELLSLVRGDRETEFRSVRFDVNARCREVLADAATRNLGRQLEFIGPGEGQLAMVGDPDRVEEAISILVDNAAKYSQAGGQVSVTTRRRRDHVLVEVSDTGAGIPDEDLPHIFDRFYRSDASRSAETGGFGLGLAIAKRIIETAGGEIEVRSTLGSGSTFTVRLPRGRP